MPLLNKNNAARSRRSSIESQLNDPAASSATPTSELWTSQGSDVSFYEDMPSPEQQERHVSVKRSSVFKIRARSNTATSTSSFVSFSSAMVRLDTTRSSQDLLDLPGTRRPLFTRRKTGKRRSGQVSPSSQFQEEESADANKRTSVLRKGRKNGNQPGSTCELYIGLD